MTLGKTIYHLKLCHITFRDGEATIETVKTLVVSEGKRKARVNWLDMESL